MDVVDYCALFYIGRYANMLNLPCLVGYVYLLQCKVFVFDYFFTFRVFIFVLSSFYYDIRPEYIKVYLIYHSYHKYAM
jgi:hypothetical protein